MRRAAEKMKWSLIDKLSLGVVLFGLFVAPLWLAFPTSRFIQPISLTLTDRRVVFVRELPLGTVHARWRTEITMPDGFECNSGDWKFARYQVIRANRVSYDLQPWADACLKIGPPFYMSTTRQVLVFGLLPLPSATHVVEIPGLVDPEIILIIPKEE